MRKTRFLALVGLLLVPGAFTRSITAQTTFGAISGTVRDATGAVIPNATIEATHLDSNYGYTATSNERGNYTLPLLREGEYRLKARAAGFHEFMTGGIRLAARDERRVEIVLQVGEMEVNIRVDTGPALIETDTPRISDY